MDEYPIQITGFVPNIVRIKDSQTDGKIVTGHIFCNDGHGWTMNRINEDGTIRDFNIAGGDGAGLATPFSVGDVPNTFLAVVPR